MSADEFTEKNPKWFYNVNETPELKILEENYSVILEELNQLRKNSENGYWLSTFQRICTPIVKTNGKYLRFNFLESSIL
jgi:hypothetical protein